MVDLVKIRKKSKDSKEASEAAVRPESPAVDETVERAPAKTAQEPPASQPQLDELQHDEPMAVEVEVAPDVEPAPPAPPPPPTVAAAKKPERADAAKVTPKVNTPEPVPPPSAPLSEGPVPSEPLAIETQDEPDLEHEDRLTRFKRLAGKRRSGTATARTGEQERVETEEKAELELLRFRVAEEDYAVDIDKIVEIVPPRATTRVPNADEAIVGIISLRGTIVTVIDLRRKLGHPKVDFQGLKDARMIVVERAGETAGFLVDRVSRVVKLDPAQLESHPVVSSTEQSEYVSGVFQSQDGLVILLDIERILAG